MKEQLQQLCNSIQVRTDDYFLMKDNPFINVDFNKLILNVSKFLDVSINDLYSKNRHRKIVEARAIIFYILRDKYNLTLHEIGRMFNKDHATVLHSCRKHKDLTDVKFGDKAYISKYKKIEKLNLWQK